MFTILELKIILEFLTDMRKFIDACENWYSKDEYAVLCIALNAILQRVDNTINELQNTAKPSPLVEHKPNQSDKNYETYITELKRTQKPSKPSYEEELSPCPLCPLLQKIIELQTTLCPLISKFHDTKAIGRSGRVDISK